MFRTEDAGRDTTGIWVEKVKEKKKLKLLPWKSHS